MQRKVIVYNTLAQFGGKLISILFNLGTVYILTHHYSLADFGEYTAVFSYLLLFNILADLGLSTILVRDIATYPDRAKFLGNIFLIRISSLFLSLGLGVLIAQFIPQYSQAVKLGIIIASISTFFLLLTTLVSSIFQANLRMERGVFANILGVFANFILVLVFTRLNLSINYAILAVSLAYIIMFAFSLVFALTTERIVFSIDTKLWKIILKQSITVGGTLIFSTIYFKADSVILSLMRPLGDVSLYGVPYKIFEVGISIPQMFMAPVFAILTTQWAKKNIEGFKNLFQKAFDVLLLGAFPIIPLTFFMSPKLIPFYAGERYIKSIQVLDILSIALFLSFIGSSYIYIILTLKKQSYLLVWNIILSVFNIFANILFIPYFTYYASAWLTVATELLVLIGSIYVVSRTLSFLPAPGIALKALIATIVLCILLIITSSLNFLIQAAIACLGYMIVLLSLKVYSLEDLLAMYRESNIAKQEK